MQICVVVSSILLRNNQTKSIDLIAYLEVMALIAVN